MHFQDHPALTGTPPAEGNWESRVPQQPLNKGSLTLSSALPQPQDADNSPENYR